MQKHSLGRVLSVGLAAILLGSLAPGEAKTTPFDMKTFHAIAADMGVNTDGMAADVRFLAVPAPAIQATSDTKEWVQTQLGEVYKGRRMWTQDKIDSLLIDLWLLSPKELAAAHNRFKARWGTDEPPTPTMSEALAQKVVAGFQFLQGEGLVIVELGSTGRDEVSWDRTGVMSRGDFEKMFKNGVGHNLASYPCSLDKERPAYSHCDYKAMFEFLEFGYQYDGAGHQWIPKYTPGSLEAFAVQRTEQILKTIYEADPYYRKGEFVRQTITEKTSELVQVARERAFAFGRSREFILNELLEQTITEINEGRKVYGHPITR